jgi:hypothetical protein
MLRKSSGTNNEQNALNTLGPKLAAFLHLLSLLEGSAFPFPSPAARSAT